MNTGLMIWTIVIQALHVHHPSRTTILTPKITPRQRTKGKATPDTYPSDHQMFLQIVGLGEEEAVADLIGVKVAVVVVVEEEEEIAACLEIVGGLHSVENEISTSRPASPTSLAIARATGRTPHNSSLESQQIPPNTGTWGYNQTSLQQQQFLYQQQQQFTFGQQMYLPQVQPHINPRFASAFGVAVGPVHQQQQQHYQINQYSQPFNGDALAPSIEPSWTDEWTVRTDERSSSGQPGESGNTGQ